MRAVFVYQSCEIRVLPIAEVRVAGIHRREARGRGPRGLGEREREREREPRERARRIIGSLNFNMRNICRTSSVQYVIQCCHY